MYCIYYHEYFQVFVRPKKKRKKKHRTLKKRATMNDIIQSNPKLNIIIPALHSQLLQARALFQIYKQLVSVFNRKKPMKENL